MRKLVYLVVITISIYCIFSPSLAGGPLLSWQGRPVVYHPNDFPIPYNPDQGSLGSFDNTEAAALVQECFQTWQDVPTATITFQNNGALTVDVDQSNYTTYIDNFNDGLNPIIFDDDGSIIDREFGSGSSSYILGFAGSAFNASSGYYVEGVAVLNGKFAGILTYEDFKGTFTHEFGHFLGLDHTQINEQFAADGNISNDVYLPTMFPTSTDDDTQIADLNPDDKAAITLLYPAANMDTFYGKIQGTVTRGNGEPVLGANVVAVDTNNEDMNQFSSVSDYLMKHDGLYEMLVTPGTYKLFIEPINKAFNGGSSVGPYAGDLNQPSFTNPVTKEYYNGDRESANENDLNDYEEVIISAGETVSEIDFIAEGGLSTSTTTTFSTTTIPSSSTTSTVEPTTTSTSPSSTTTTTVPKNTSPTASFSVAPDSGNTKTTFTVDASSSEDREDSTDQLKVRWDWENDTVWDTEFSTEKTATHRYHEKGTYIITLEVMDTHGLTDSAFAYVSVKKALCPVAMLLGDSDHHTDTLRKFRDRVLTRHKAGKKLIQLYYDTAVNVVALIERHPVLKKALTVFMHALSRVLAIL